MKKAIYIILILVLILNFVIILPNYCFAEDTISGLGDLNKYKGDGDESQKLQDKINPIIYIIQMIGSIVSVVALIAIGMKYMLGSIEEKAEYKKTLLPYIIGAIIVFSISNLVGFIFNIAKDLFS